jgi:hypothetical protein
MKRLVNFLDTAAAVIVCAGLVFAGYVGVNCAANPPAVHKVKRPNVFIKVTCTDLHNTPVYMNPKSIKTIFEDIDNNTFINSPNGRYFDCRENMFKVVRAINDPPSL